MLAGQNFSVRMISIENKVVKMLVLIFFFTKKQTKIPEQLKIKKLYVLHQFVLYLIGIAGLL